MRAAAGMPSTEKLTLPDGLSCTMCAPRLFDCEPDVSIASPVADKVSPSVLSGAVNLS